MMRRRGQVNGRCKSNSGIGASEDYMAAFHALTHWCPDFPASDVPMPRKRPKRTQGLCVAFAFRALRTASSAVAVSAVSKPSIAS